MKKLLIIICVFLCFTFTVKASELNISGKSAILMDENTGTIMFSLNENERMPMASMTKIMSMILIMEALDNEVIKLDDEVVISENAASMGGSQIYLKAMDKYTVRDLLKSVAMASANDSVVALAERTFGSVEAFVNKMNEKSEELGLLNTHFVNPHGLDAADHYSSAYDMAIMAKELLKHEEILNYTKVYEEYLKKSDGSNLWLVNTNKLVRFYDGLDGLKTGYTKGAGYCITATAKKNNMRLIAVVMGSDTIENRSQDVVKMLNYGFNSYRNNVIKSKGESLGQVKVLRGKEKYVDVYLTKDATELLNASQKKSEYHFKLNIDKIVAPVKKGTIIGNVTIFDNDNNVINKVDITVNKDVKKANIWDLFKRRLSTLTSY
ncbi:MAG: D-alanyl-D-alanine carboxypeptidase [Bacilli bacterium]|nr:D-alanyl-D-alanine carboxypeptidase [Bacilli bacterium]